VIHQQSFSDLRHKYRQGQLSPVDVTRSALQHAERVASLTNAFALLDADRALAAARRSERRWRDGLPVGDLDGMPMTAEDCFSLVLAEDNKSSILLTGDAELRNVAVSKGCEVHGVIWVTDEIHNRSLLASVKLAQCLEAWLNDPLVRLPVAHLNTRLRLLSKK
jgi:Asp-tRNA(Asn)/Glu-tRNA(Gln) amidotransferase A subunit family amidase